ncbi:MAG: hypothetical protein K0R50_1399 [Eubacterium sp.]|nr:hypothetical protein [Eubacterium sp.]
MHQPKLRHELKHSINYADYITLRQRLKLIAQQDPNVDENGKYKIRSLYFDNFDNKALMEKINGINNREKFRIRYYNDDYSFIRLEKKGKINGLCFKRSAKLTVDQCNKLIAGDLEWMKRSTEPLIIELNSKMNYQQLKPRTLVDYVREPYIYVPGNVRITIDTGIKTGLASRELFNKELPTLKTSRDLIILEVKYDEFLPNIIRDIIQIDNRRGTAFSKYAECRIFG